MVECSSASSFHLSPPLHFWLLFPKSLYIKVFIFQLCVHFCQGQRRQFTSTHLDLACLGFSLLVGKEKFSLAGIYPSSLLSAGLQSMGRGRVCLAGESNAWERTGDRAGHLIQAVTGSST